MTLNEFVSAQKLNENSIETFGKRNAKMLNENDLIKIITKFYLGGDLYKADETIKSEIKDLLVSMNIKNLNKKVKDFTGNVIASINKKLGNVTCDLIED